MTRRLVIYHAGCVDGLVAAWVASRHWDSAAEFLPAQYGDVPPDVGGRDVLIVDFSYPRETLLAMHAAAASVRVLDHHKTAQEALVGLSFCVFDMERSGAGLAWDELAGGRRPWLVDYAEDRDLWRWKLPDSRAVNAYLQVLPRTIDDFDRVAAWDVETAAFPGQAVLLAQRAYLDVAKATARMGVIAGRFRVPIVNAGAYCASELVGEIAEGMPFGAAWYQRADGWIVYSLRSREGGIDVAAVAQEFGGGGHRNAAGFTTSGVVHTEAP